ncbi:MAG: hypothetical protein MUF07_19275 [Steroidobacteraceae bacterium]|jgi:hypothetical protein|nr:hypothetical protein [Steroidobacteraceae bacterium]
MPMRFAVALALALPFAAGAAIPGAPGTARPQPSPLHDYFALRGSYFQPALTTAGRFDSDAGTRGTDFSGEDDLGLDDRADQGRMEVSFRMRERHLLRVDYLKLTRYGENTLTRTINFRNQVYRVGDRVATNLDWRMLGFNYSFAALRRETFELGVGAGLHLLEADARSEVRARNLRETGNGTAVLPTLGLDGTWAFHRRWSLNGFARYLSVGTGDGDGSFTDLHLDVQYRWRPNVAIGLGYSSIGIDVDVTDADLPGRLDLEAAGPEVFFRVSF